VFEVSVADQSGRR